VLVLGIESSCDETAAAVVDDARGVRSSVVASQVEIHREYGGVVPEIASREHEKRIIRVIDRAVDDAGVTLGDLDAVAIGHRPGLIGSLLVGLSAAKGLAWALGIPIVGVDHIHAHLFAGALDREMPETPALGVVVSGGHSALYRMGSMTDLERLGGTIDDAIGEAYDKAATILGLPYPGGPEIDALAQDPDADDRAFDLPVARLSKDSLDLSYSGLKTALLYTVNGKPAPPRVPGKPALVPEPVPEMTRARRRDLAASFQRAAVRALMLKIERALERHRDARSLILGGGVSANSRVRRDAARIARDRGLALVLPEMRYCVDNAAMIAGLGALRMSRGETDDLDLAAAPTAAF